MIDTHVNLHHPDFAADFDAVIVRARAAGVTQMITISDRLDTLDAQRAAAERAAAWRTVGVHPHHAKDCPGLTGERLADLAAGDPRVVAIGETGLDLHYGYSPLEEQITAFRAHAAAARATGLPLIVHTRNADDLTAAVLEEEHAKGGFPILLHCYTSGLGLLSRGLALGGFVSFSGIATFRKAEEVRAAFDATPDDRVLIETDCPYLAPVPMRGRRNEPAFLPHVAAFLAARRGVPADAFAARADANARRLFSRIGP